MSVLSPVRVLLGLEDRIGKGRVGLVGHQRNALLTIRQQLYTHIQKLDFAFFDSRPTGKILSRIIGDINSLKDVLSNSVTTLIPDMITVIAVVGIMFTKNPKLAAASLISTPFMVGTCASEVAGIPKEKFQSECVYPRGYVRDADHQELHGGG